MMLTHETLAAITRGADRTLTHEKTGRFLMRRCTEKQTEAYGRELGREFANKCEMTAGIRFDFWTDSQTVAFDYTVGRRASVIWMSIDLYADGVMVAADYKDTHQSFDKYSFSYTFEEKKRRRVTIYLPYMIDLQVSEFRLDDGAECTPYTDYAGRMLCFGDSITHGYLAHYSSCTYPAHVARFFNYDFSNQGNAGYVFDGETVDADLHFKPDVITVAFGTNDWSKLGSNEEYVSRAEGFFDAIAAAYPGIPVYAILPLWRPDKWRPKKTGKFEDCRAQLRAIMEAHGCIVVDGMQAVPNVAEFFDDYRLHPNDLGFGFYAQHVIGEMVKHQK